jgi:hypothetical protein
MSEVWARVVLVAGILAVATAIALIQRRRRASPVRTVPARGLATGVYFFSSAACSTCDLARNKLDRRLGEDGYTEFSWEQHPESFSEHRVDQVPAVLVVGDAGSARLHLGQPEGALDP